MNKFIIPILTFIIGFLLCGYVIIFTHTEDFVINLGNLTDWVSAVASIAMAILAYKAASYTKRTWINDKLLNSYNIIKFELKKLNEIVYILEKFIKEMNAYKDNKSIDTNEEDVNKDDNKYKLNFFTQLILKDKNNEILYSYNIESLVNELIRINSILKFKKEVSDFYNILVKFNDNLKKIYLIKNINESIPPELDDIINFVHSYNSRKNSLEETIISSIKNL